MTITLEPQKLLFPFDTEYTIDNGTTWTALAANTAVTIAVDDMNEERKISVRSSSVDATTLEGMDIGISDVAFDEINVRNATALTYAKNSFRGLASKKFILSNAQNLKYTTDMLSDASVSEVFIDELPRACDSPIFRSGSYGYISAISIGRLATDDDKCYAGSMFSGSSVDIIAGVNIANARSGPRYMFYSGVLGAVGHISVSTASTPLTSQLGDNMFYNANVEYIPSMKIINNAADITSSYQFSYMFRSLNYGKKDSYYPSIDISVRTGDYSAAFYSIFSVQPQVIFGGVSVDACSTVDNSMFESGDYLSSAKKYISKLNLQSGYAMNDYVLAALSLNEKKRTYYSNPDWFPFVACLGVYSNSSFTGTVSAGPQNFIHMLAKTTDNGIDVFGSTKYKSAKNAVIDSLKTKEIVDAEFAVFCKNGYCAYTDGIDTIIADESDATISTISGVAISNAQFSSDGLKLYVVNGGDIDKSGTSGQQMTYTVDVYNTQDGTKIGDTISVPLGADEWVAGVYQKDDNYGLKVVVNVWSVEQDADGNDLPYSFKEVRVDSYEPTGTSELLLSEVSGSGECTYVMQDYFESNEFAIVDAVAGTVQRVVGK